MSGDMRFVNSLVLRTLPLQYLIVSSMLTYVEGKDLGDLITYSDDR